MRWKIKDEPTMMGTTYCRDYFGLYRLFEQFNFDKLNGTRQSSDINTAHE